MVRPEGRGYDHRSPKFGDRAGCFRPGQTKNKVAMVTGAAGLALTGSACTPNTVHWVWDTYGNANAVALPLLKKGLDKWFYIAADYSFGAELTQQASAIVEKNGGKNLGV